MTFDAHKNFAYGLVLTPPNPANSGVTVVLGTGFGNVLPATPFNAVVWPVGQQPSATNAEIVRVTNVSSDSLTITRAQEGTSARTIVAGDQFAEAITAKMITDVEAAAAGALQPANNLSDVVTPSTARTNLGLGSAATQASSAFDAAGAAAAAQAASDPAGAASAAQAAAQAASEPGLTPTSVKTTTYTAVSGDFVACDVTSAGFTVTLPTAPGNKTRIAVKIVANAGTPNVLTIAAGGSDVFNVTAGSTSLTLTAKFASVILKYSTTGAIWYVQSTDASPGQAGGAAQLDTSGKLPIAQAPASVVLATSALDTGAWAASTHYTVGKVFTTGAGQRRLVVQDFTSGATFGLAASTDGTVLSAAEMLCSVPLSGSSKRTTTVLNLKSQGVKLRGICEMNTVAQANWQTYWSNAGSATTLALFQAKVTQLVADGFNAIRIAADWTALNAGVATLAQNMALWESMLAACDAAGLYVYPVVVTGAATYNGNGGFFSTATASQQQQWIQALGALCQHHPCVIGAMVSNEFERTGTNNGSGGTPPGASVTIVQNATAYLRAVTDLPLSWSMSSAFQGAASGTIPATGATNFVPTGWLALFAANSDFLDFHCDNFILTLAQYQWYEQWYPKMPILLGETAGNGTTPDTALAPTIRGTQQLHDRASCAGSMVFAINDFGAAGTQYGFYDIVTDANATPAISNLFIARPSALNAARLLARRFGYAGSTDTTVVGPASPVSLTTSLTTVPSSSADLVTSLSDAGPGDPQFRYVVKATGLSASDVLSAAAVDADSGAVLNPGGTATTTTATTQTGSSPDASASAVAAYAVGAVTADASGEFSAALAIPSGGYLHLNRTTPVATGDAFTPLPQLLSGVNTFTVEFWFKRSRSGVFEDLISNQGGIGWLGRASWHLAFNFSNKLQLSYNRASDDTNATITSTGAAITDTNWHSCQISFDGTTLRLFQDGTLVGSAAPTSGLAVGQGYGGNNAILVGILGGTSLTNPFVGSIDEIRISKTARNTATYTPAVAAFTTDANTLGLWHCDALNTNALTVVKTPWVYVPPGPAVAQLQVANTSGARGSVVSASRQVRYTG